MVRLHVSLSYPWLSCRRLYPKLHPRLLLLLLLPLLLLLRVLLLLLRMLRMLPLLLPLRPRLLRPRFRGFVPGQEYLRRQPLEPGLGVRPVAVRKQRHVPVIASSSSRAIALGGGGAGTCRQRCCRRGCGGGGIHRGGEERGEGSSVRLSYSLLNHRTVGTTADCLAHETPARNLGQKCPQDCYI